MAPEVERKKRPAYQWYPGDWKRDTAVQACPFLVRAIWREMLDIMHDGEPYGHLTAGGKAIDANTLADMIPGVSRKQAREALAELGERKVFSRTAGGVIYCRRMVREEAIREARATGGAQSLNHPNVPQPKASKDVQEDPPQGPPLRTPLKDLSDPRARDHTRDRACRAANADADLNPPDGVPALGVGVQGAGEAWADWRETWEAAGRRTLPLTPRKCDEPDFAEIAKRYPDQAHRRTLLRAAFTSRHQPLADKPMTPRWFLYWADWLDQQAASAPVPSSATGGDDWFEECQRLHGGKCNGSGGHRLQMQIDAEKTKKGAA